MLQVQAQTQHNYIPLEQYLKETMSPKVPTQPDNFSLLAAISLLCSTSVHCLSSGQSDLQPLSELLAWVILLAMCRTAVWHNRPPGQQADDSHMEKKDTSAASTSLWAVSIALAVYCFSAADSTLLLFQPASIPLLIVAQYKTCHRSDRPLNAPTGSGSSNRHLSTFASLLTSSPFVSSAFVALFSIATQKSDWRFGESDAAGLIPLAALTVVFGTLEARRLQPAPLRLNRASRAQSALDVEDTVAPLASRIVPLMLVAKALQHVSFGSSAGEGVLSLVLGAVKALSWYMKFYVVCNVLGEKALQ